MDNLLAIRFCDKKGNNQELIEPFYCTVRRGKPAKSIRIPSSVICIAPIYSYSTSEKYKSVFNEKDYLCFPFNENFNLLMEEIDSEEYDKLPDNYEKLVKKFFARLRKEFPKCFKGSLKLNGDLIIKLSDHRSYTQGKLALWRMFKENPNFLGLFFYLDKEGFNGKKISFIDNLLACHYFGVMCHSYPRVKEYYPFDLDKYFKNNDEPTWYSNGHSFIQNDDIVSSILKYDLDMDKILRVIFNMEFITANPMMAYNTYGSSTYIRKYLVEARRSTYGSRMGAPSYSEFIAYLNKKYQQEF